MPAISARMRLRSALSSLRFSRCSGSIYLSLKRCRHFSLVFLLAPFTGSFQLSCISQLPYIGINPTSSSGLERPPRGLHLPWPRRLPNTLRRLRRRKVVPNMSSDSSLTRVTMNFIDNTAALTNQCSANITKAAPWNFSSICSSSPIWLHLRRITKSLIAPPSRTT